MAGLILLIIQVALKLLFWAESVTFMPQSLNKGRMVLPTPVAVGG